MAVEINLLGSTTSKDISECEIAIVFNNVDLGFEKLSNLNYLNVITKVRESGEYVTLERAAEGEGVSFFLYKYSGSLIRGFNSIVFLDNSNTVLGYYVYPKIQGERMNCKIYIRTEIPSLDSNLPFKGEVAGSLEDLARSTSSITKFVGEDLFEYTSMKKLVKDSVIKNFYTPSILDIKLNDDKCISLNGNFLNKNNLYTLDIKTNLNVDAFNCKYTNFSIGYFMNDLVLYEWKDIKYKEEAIEQRQYFNILSLTKTNNFGNPISYVKRPIISDISRDDWDNSNESYLGGDSTERFDALRPKSKIMFGSGRYLVGEVYSDKPAGDYFRVFNTEKSLSESGTWCDDWGEDLANYNIFLDEWSFNSRVYKINKVGSTLSYETAITECPELVNNFTNFKEFLDDNSASLTIVKKIGNWFLFRYNYSDITKVFVLSGIYGDIYLSLDDLDKLIVINDNTVLLKEENYYVMYHCYKTIYYTERARNILEGGSLETLTVNGQNILFNIVEKNSQEIYKGYYKEGIIEVIPNSIELFKTSLNRYRKRSYTLDIQGIPNIIGACNGLIFYLKDNKYINYL